MSPCRDHSPAAHAPVVGAAWVGALAAVLLAGWCGVSAAVAQTRAASAPGRRGPVRPAPSRVFVRGDGNYPPYEYLDEDGRPAGFSIDLIRAVGEVMDLEVEIRLGRWDDVRADLSAGRTDVITGMFYSRERDEKLDFSIPTVVIHHAVFVRKGSDIRSLADAKGKEAIVRRGDIMHDHLRATGLTDRIVTVGSPADALRLLASGRHDCALVAKLQGQHLAKKFHLSNIETVGPPICSREYCFAVQEGDAHLLSRLNEGLNVLKNVGRYKKIHEKWFGVHEPSSAVPVSGIIRSIISVVVVLMALLSGSFLWSWSLRRRVKARTRELRRELTERKRAEEERERLAEQLRHSQRMEAIGQLAGGVAHDFNNILTAIQGNAELLKTTVADGDERAEMVDQIVQSSRRAADLTHQLLSFARKGKFQMVLLDIHDTIHDVVSILQHSIDRRIHVALNFGAVPSTVMGDRTQLQSALLNLGLNARDAMPEGGELTFATEVCEVDEEFVGVERPGIPPGRYIRVCVTDTGTGMDKRTQERVFEPFFTTKEVGQGTGLGLASVYGCMRSHRGGIEVDSRAGQGSTFRVFLPLAEAARGHAEAEAEAQPVRGSGHVLVVDDEEIVRNYACRALQSLGYTVATCRDGAEAIAHYRKHRRRIDLVIIDLVMPKLDGRQTFRRLREIDPGVRAILSSGYSEDYAARGGAEDGVLDFLGKPFRIEELSRMVARHIKAVPAGASGSRERRRAENGRQPA